MHSLTCFLTSLALLGCTADLMDDSLNEEQADTVCRTADLIFSSAPYQPVMIDMADDRDVSYTGTLEMTDFDSHYTVSTEDVIVRPAVNDSFTIEIESDTFDFFTTMQFVVDMREVTEKPEKWVRFDLIPESELIGWWFERLEVHQYVSQVVYTSTGASLSNCALDESVTNEKQLPAGTLKDRSYEYLVRAYPKSGFGDLAGTYSYTISVHAW